MSEDDTSRQGWTALVLAGARPGDPLAAAEGLAAKHFAEIGGASLIARVLGAIDQTPWIDRVIVAADAATPPEALEGLTSKPLSVVGTADGAPATALAVLNSEAGAPPLVVTTSDNALLTPAILKHFIAAAHDENIDLAVGLADSRTIRSRYPDVQRTYLKFRGGTYSGCNLFAAKTPEAGRVFAFWKQAEALRKSPVKLARLFGVRALFLYVAGLLTLDQAFALASRKLAVKARPILIPYAEAAIDVDKPSDLELARRIAAGKA